MDQAGTADRKYPKQMRNNDLSSESDLSKKERRQRSMRLFQSESRGGFKELSNRLKAFVHARLSYIKRSINTNEYSRTAASTSHAQHHEKILNNPSRLLLPSRQRYRNFPLPKRCTTSKRLEMPIAAHEKSSKKKWDVLLCRICRYRTVNVESMKWHMENDHSSEKERQCLLCLQTLASYTSLQQHLQTHEDRISARCMKDFLSESRSRNKYREEMLNRIKSIMESSPPAPSSSSSSNPRKTPANADRMSYSPAGILFNCESCPAMFREVKDLQRHCETVHRCMNDAELYNYCKLCHKVYFSETEFVDHLSTIHDISMRISKPYAEEIMLLHNENTSTDEQIIDSPVFQNNTSLNLQ